MIDQRAPDLKQTNDIAEILSFIVDIQGLTALFYAAVWHA